MKKLVSAILAVMLIVGAVFPVFAAEDEIFDFEGKDWDDIAAEFMERYGIDPDTLAFGYYNTVTGEEYYHNGDQYMISASVYKLPLNMYFSEKIYNGELDWSDTIGSWTYEEIQHYSMEFSNNELSEMLRDSIGTFQQYRAAIAPYCGFESDDMNEHFFNANVFTPEQIMYALKLLYNEPDRYPRMIEYMKKANQDNFFCYNEDRFEIAHKYGYTDAEGYYVINDVGIVYTDDPIILVMFTNHCAGSIWTLTRYCTIMCDWTQYKHQQRIEAQAQESQTPQPEEKIQENEDTVPEQVTVSKAPENEPKEPDRGNNVYLSAAMLIAVSLLGLSLVVICRGRKKIAALALWAVMSGGTILVTGLPLTTEHEQTDAVLSSPEATYPAAAQHGTEPTGEPAPAPTPEPTPVPTPEPKEYTLGGESAGEIVALADIDSLEYIDARASSEYEAIFELRKARPDCEIVWQLELFGQIIDGQSEKLTVSGDGTAEELEQILKWLPELKKLDIRAMSLENDEAQELIEAHPELDIVWSVNVGPWRVPSNATCFSTLQSAPPATRYTSEDLAPLFEYCTELVALDLGHNDLTDISGLANLKKLKVLILIDNPNLEDMSPIGELEGLEYLEFFLNKKVKDMSCLNKLVNMVDINLSYSPALDNIDFLENMPQLRRAWLRGCSIPTELWNQAKEEYPEVEFTFWHASSVSSTCGSWRADERNVAIRQAFTNWKYVSDFNSWDDISYEAGAKLTTVYPEYEN